MKHKLQLFSPQQSYNFSSKAIFVGSSSVGKTSLLDKYTFNRFNPHLSKPSVGLNYIQTLCQIPSTTLTMKLDFWDTAGSQRYKTITPAFYRKSAAIVFVFDLTNRESFEDIEKWMREAFEAVEDDIVKVLVGNKSDGLFERKVGEEEGRGFARERGMEYWETSAKTGDNVVEMFEGVAGKIMEKFGGEGKKGGYLVDMNKERILLKKSRLGDGQGEKRRCRC